MNRLSRSYRVALSAAIFVCSVFSGSAYADRIVVFGATGTIGKLIVREALDRGHEVVGVSRNPDNFEYTEANFIGLAGNPTLVESVLEAAQGADAVINAVGSSVSPTPQETPMYQSANAITQAFADLGDESPLVVAIAGGTTTYSSEEEMLNNPPANRITDPAALSSFIGHRRAYEIYRDSNINWTVVTPPMGVVGYRSGTDLRTGSYNTAINNGFVLDAEGENSIFMSDLAVAAVDFAESGEFNRTKVAVGN